MKLVNFDATSKILTAYSIKYTIRVIQFSMWSYNFCLRYLFDLWISSFLNILNLLRLLVNVEFILMIFMIFVIDTNYRCSNIRIIFFKTTLVIGKICKRLDKVRLAWNWFFVIICILCYFIDPTIIFNKFP